MDQKQKWQERLFGAQLTVCRSVSATNEFRTVTTTEALRNVEVIGVYFSFANINLKSDELVKKLRDLYERLSEDSQKNGSKRFEIVQVVLWAHNDVYCEFETSHRDCLMGMPWYGMPYSEIDLKVSAIELLLPNFLFYILIGKNFLKSKINLHREKFHKFWDTVYTFLWKYVFNQLLLNLT